MNNHFRFRYDIIESNRNGAISGPMYFRFRYDSVRTANFNRNDPTSGPNDFRFRYDVIVDTSGQITSFPVSTDFRFRYDISKADFNRDSATSGPNDFRFGYDVISNDAVRACGSVTEKVSGKVPVLHVCRSADDMDPGGTRTQRSRTRINEQGRWLEAAGRRHDGVQGGVTHQSSGRHRHILVVVVVVVAVVVVIHVVELN